MSKNLGRLVSHNSLLTYEDGLDSRRFQAVLARGDSRTIHDARFWFSRDTRESVWIKRLAHWGGHGAIWRQGIAPWLGLPFLRCTEARRKIECAAEIVNEYVHVLSNNLPAASLYFLTLDTLLNRLHAYGHFDYWAKVIILERRLKYCGDSCCFTNWNFVHVYAIPPLDCLVSFVPV